MTDTDITGLYQELIVDHSGRRRNFRPLENPSHTATGYNPLCGDRITVFLNVVAGTAREVTFQGDGCAISMASASLMTEAAQGRTIAEIERLCSGFHDFVVSGQEARGENLGKLVVFSKVHEFPVRVKCATLAWHTLGAALANRQETVSTESEAVAITPAAKLMLESRIVDALHTCFDPEIPANIYDLGLIYRIDISDEGSVSIDMSLTTPNCPVATSLPIEVESKVKAIEGVRDVRVRVVWDPPWSQDKMSDSAKLQLGML